MADLNWMISKEKAAAKKKFWKKVSIWLWSIFFVLIVTITGFTAIVGNCPAVREALGVAMIYEIDIVLFSAAFVSFLFAICIDENGPIDIGL